jgi:DNA-binding NarL/FixJ family response regulator
MIVEFPGGSTEAFVLSRRERQVAALVARGLTNRQIAIELVVSARTAETYVSRILRKLELRSRTQLAVWAFEHGLARPHHPRGLRKSNANVVVQRTPNRVRPT